MTTELQEELKRKYPQIFRDLWGDITKTGMAFGIQVEDGWYGIIDRLCSDIMDTKPGKDFKAEQVKEKFGGLRFYVSAHSDKISDLIGRAEEESFRTCEMCGTTEDVTSEGSWIRTLCSDCREKRLNTKWEDTGDGRSKYPRRPNNGL